VETGLYSGGKYSGDGSTGWGIKARKGVQWGGLPGEGDYGEKRSTSGRGKE